MVVAVAVASALRAAAAAAFVSAVFVVPATAVHLAAATSCVGIAYLAATLNTGDGALGPGDLLNLPYGTCRTADNQ